MAHWTDPRQIGQRYHPEVHETAAPFRNRPLRSETVQKEYQNPKDIWTGEGYQARQAVLRLTHRYLGEVLHG